MNKAELIEVLAQHYGGNKSEASRALSSVVETVTYSTARGEKVSITGFGVFEKIDRPARMVRNPRTGERTRAKKTSVPRFRAGSEFKAYVAGDKKVPKPTKTASAPTTKTARAAKQSTAKAAAPPATKTARAAKQSTAKSAAPPATKTARAAKQSTAKSAAPPATKTARAAKKSTTKTAR